MEIRYMERDGINHHKPIEISKPKVTNGWGQHSPIFIQQSVLLDASLLSEMQLKVETFGCKNDVEPERKTASHLMKHRYQKKCQPLTDPNLLP